MGYLKYLLLLVLLTAYVNAQEYNIVAFTTKKVYTSDKQNFLSKFPSGHINKQEKYYVFEVGPFKRYTLAHKTLSDIQEYYPDAFIVNSKTTESTEYSLKPQTTINKVVPLNEVSLSKRNNHIPLASLNVNTHDTSPSLSEPKILENYEIPKSFKMADTQLYDIVHLKSYLSSLFEYNEQDKESFYQKKIDYLLAEIKKDTYNFDIYIDGYIDTGEDLRNTVDYAPISETGVRLHADKRLYDGGYKLRNIYEILNKRIANIREIDAKDRLTILGISIYSDLFDTQERLALYKKILEEQKYLKNIIAQKYKKSTSSILDFIDAKNDYINIQRVVTDATYAYLHNDYILRHSIKSRSQKPLKLFPVSIDLNLDSLTLLQKEAIVHNTGIAMESNRLKLTETDFLNQKRRYYPEVDFLSYVGYGYYKNNTFDFSNGATGTSWNVGLYFKIPIYNRNDIRLNTEKSQYDILLQKNILSQTQRDILIQTHRSYNELIRIKKQKNFTQELLTLAEQKLEVAKVRYLNGVAQYRDYSEALNRVIQYENQLIQINSNFIKESAILSILIGERKFYGSN